jgi:hypothetical protein
MEEQTCAKVRKALRRAIQPAQPMALEPPMAEHIAGCDACRGALLLILSELSGTPVAELEIDCARCLEDLPAFVELEMAARSHEAARVYPHVWWHLWTCVECAETYDITRALFAAELRGDMRAFSRARLMRALNPPVIHLLRLTRQFLNWALPALAPLAAARGTAEGPKVLSEGDATTGHSFTLSVQQQPDLNWLVEVLVTPPTSGWLVLTLGDTAFRARFDSQGLAAVAGVPAALFAAQDGPDMAVGIEADEDTAILPGL